MKIIEIKNNTLYGFSIGAYMLMELATKTKIDKIVLISPAPIFSDMLTKIPVKVRKFIRKDMVEQMISEVCGKIDCEVEIYVGELEEKYMILTAKKVAKELGVKLNIVKNAKHSRKLFNKVLNKK